MNQTLIEMVVTATKIENHILENSADPNAMAFVDDLLKAIVQKVDACAVVLDRMAVSEEYWRSRAREAEAVGRSLSNAQTRLKNYIKDSMQISQTVDLHGDDYRFKLSESKPKLVIDETQLSSEWLRVVQITEPDKEKIEHALRGGEIITGARLEPVKSLRKYPNKGK